MDIGAVIVAAGLSSRMGDFKPMMKIGTATVAQHVVNAFRQAGISKIVVVTGHHADKLEQHLAADDIVFLRNENYQTSEMFDSAKIGFAYWVGKCDRVLFTPVDVPLFSAHTVTKLIQSGARLASPVCNGKQGHPLMLEEPLLHELLRDNGPGGVKGALSRMAVPMTHVEVDDPGILRDADTPEEFAALVDYYNSRPGYPSEQEMDQMLLEMETPAQVRAHCAAVAQQAEKLAAQVNVPVDLGLLRAACLLHDMARAKGKDHAALAEQYLREKGYPLTAQMVAMHHDLTQQAPIEAELLYLADKLVKETTRVDLHERFLQSKGKCGSAEALENWHRRYRDALRIVERYQLDLEMPAQQALE